MNVLIIEDEKGPAQHLIEMLSETIKGVRILNVLTSVKAATKWLIENDPPDLIFSDVHLSDATSFEIYDSIQIHVPIIFVTAYDQYALQAFQYNSIDYLIKPISQEDLDRAIEKYKQQNIGVFDPKALIDAFNQPKTNFQKRFMVTAGERIKSISVDEISYFFGKDKYVYLISVDNDRYIVDHTLTQLEEMVDPQDFFRINRQFLIAFKGIANMIAYSRGRVKVELDPPSKEDSIVSIDRASAFKSWLNR